MSVRQTNRHKMKTTAKPCEILQANLAMDDDNMIFIFSYQSPPGMYTNETINNTASSTSDLSPEVHFYRAIMAFLVSIILYFCLVCHAWKDDITEVKPAVVNRSIVRKKVLPHGQSHCFSERDGNENIDEIQRKPRIICCCRKPTVSVASLPETATEILDSYKLKSYGELRKQARRVHDENNDDGMNNCDEELVLAEEGMANSTNDILCPICLDSFHIDEEVAWSKLQHCKHVFHYECILPWAVLGHIHCPVCREVFWSKNRRDHNECMLCQWLKTNAETQNSLDAESLLEVSRFCVLHGLTSPSTMREESV
eukprot:CCRYP_008685-RB/>CCRYP_008685-RB protein AED:0.07 eAED:0.07 QI:1256/1/1/1/0/0/4/117/311